MNDRYLHSQMHLMICTLADKYLKQLRDEELQKLAPQDYGTEITDDHRAFVWDKFYDDISCMEPLDIYKMYQMYINERLDMRSAIDRAEAHRELVDKLSMENIALAALKKKENA